MTTNDLFRPLRRFGTLCAAFGLAVCAAVGFAQESTPGFSGDFNFSPSVLSSRTYFEGSETLGRVGYEPILKRDILHQLKKTAYMNFVEQREKAPPEAKKHFNDELFPDFCKQFISNEQFYSQVLDEYIRKLLFYNDYIVSRSKEEVEEQKKNLDKVYDKDYIPFLLKQFKCEDIQTVKDIFTEKLGTTIEQDKRLFIQQTLGDSWLEFNLGTQTYNPSAVELRRWYEAHRDLYAVPDRVRWRRMSVLFSNHPNRDEAMQKIVYMGNAVQDAARSADLEKRFEQVARTDSEDFFAANGGYCDWTGRNELNSAVIEQTLFSEELPLGAMSRILDDGYGYTILLVLERQVEHVRPFFEVQEEVREKIKEEHKNANKSRYENLLAERFAVEIYAISPEERRRQIEAAQRETESASGRESIY